MKRSACFAVLFTSLAIISALAQTTAPADPYKAVLDRLQATTTLPLTKWKAINADVPHGEFSADAGSPQPNSGPVLSFPTQSAYQQSLPLPVWLYTSVDVPGASAGFSVAGSRIALDLGIGSNTGVMVTIFVNGNMVARGDQDSQVPIVLTQSAQPGR